MSHAMNTMAYIDIHRNVVIEIRDGDKILAWASFTAPQAMSFAGRIVQLSELIQRDEAKDVEGT